MMLPPRMLPSLYQSRRITFASSAISNGPTYTVIFFFVVGFFVAVFFFVAGVAPCAVFVLVFSFTVQFFRGGPGRNRHHVARNGADYPPEVGNAQEIADNRGQGKNKPAPECGRNRIPARTIADKIRLL